MTEMNTKEAAEYLGFSASKLRRDQQLRHLGIKYSQKIIGRKEITYKQEDLDDWENSITKNSEKNLELKAA